VRDSSTITECAQVKASIRNDESAIWAGISRGRKSRLRKMATAFQYFVAASAITRTLVFKMLRSSALSRQAQARLSMKQWIKVIPWHDCDETHPGVVRLISEWRRQGKDIKRIAGTSIAYWKST